MGAIAIHLNMRMQTRTNQHGQHGQQMQQGSHMPPFCPPTRSSKSGPVKMRPAFRLPLVTQQQVSPPSLSVSRNITMIG